MKRDPATRARLLAAAERLFADRGFKKVTVREISRAARANVAAVNYHFGDKLGLYRAVLQSAIDRIRATDEAAREAAAGWPPDERLRRSIRIFVTRLLSSDCDTVRRLLQREINDPTPALDAVVEQGVRPRREYLAGLVAALIGGSASDARVLRCVASIQTQSIAYLPHPVAARFGLAIKPMTASQVETIADHIAEFSLGGVRAIARARVTAASRVRDRARAGRSSSSAQSSRD